MGRIWLCGVLALAAWLLGAHGQSRPQPLGLDAPASQFSAARADAVLGRLAGDQKPHPAGSPESAAVRGRVMKELAAMGVAARRQTQFACFSRPRWGVVSCGTVTNIIAEVLPGRGRQIVLVAHTDSVAAGPGAGDDLSGVATILETIRALKARGPTSKGAGERPIVALFTDGEESGLLGAQAYLREPLARARTGAVINVEARGNQGPSYLFQTSPGDARLVDLYADSVTHYAASSLYAEIYKVLPNDTDLTPFLQAGLTGFNFAFIGNAAQYHTPLDRRENIEPASLQHHGDNVLALADALSRTDLERLKGDDAIYLDVMGRFLPRLPRHWALPFSLGGFAVIALAGLLTRRHRRMPARPVLALLMPLLLLAGCVGLGFGLHGLAAWISGQPDPSLAHPMYLRLSLAFGAWAMAVFTARWAGGIASWLWLSALAIVCAIWVPGVTPYFLFPVLVAAPLLLASVRGGRGGALLVAALAALVIWLGLAAGGEAIMGLKMHALFMVPVGFGLVALLPVLGRPRGGAWAASVAVSLALAIACAVTAGLQPAYSAAAPQRLNLRYAEQGGKAFWLADPVPHLPQSLRAVAQFSQSPQRLIANGLADMAYVAPAGAARFAAPSVRLARSKGDRIRLDVRSGGGSYAVLVPQAANLRRVSLGGITMPMQPGAVVVNCATGDCGAMELEMGADAPLTLVETRRGLPVQGEILLKARPDTAVPSQAGDRTLLVTQVTPPKR
jgi:hypothetical protein